MGGYGGSTCTGAGTSGGDTSIGHSASDGGGATVV
jgi:hypothetical protein